MFVLDKHKKPLMPCHPARARELLAKGRARVHRLHPFTIRLVDRTVGTSALQPVRLKFDPGATTSGIAIVREADDAQHVLHLAELSHRGKAVRKHMTSGPTTAGAGARQTCATASRASTTAPAPTAGCRPR